MIKQISQKARWYIIGTLTGVGLMALVSFDNYFEISKNLEIYSAIMKELNIYYVDEIKPGELTKTGVDAMLKSLDPYTVYIPESMVEDHRMSTTGQYGGIGAQVRKKGDYVIVIEPYENSPAEKAGLQAGDMIIEVAGQSTKGKSTDDVVKFLRGAANTSVQMKVNREGAGEVTINLTREEIKIPNVPYHGMLDNEIGYIKLRGFTINAGGEVGTALADLKTKNPEIKGMVLDLRGNPGGLLREAINVVNVFVDKNQNVVSTKGKVSEWNKQYKTVNNPTDVNIPLVVLVDRGSASAAEIVSGTIQDLDRGVIVGQRSFGKGLVQTTRQLIYNAQLKLTTSKYYIPSGRCIQALDYSHRNADGSVGSIPDSLRSKFKTKSGRIVYDGGGIYPDVSIKPRKYSSILRSLLLNYLIFDFATIYKSKHPTIAPARDFVFTDNDYNDFTTYLNDKSYEYKTESEKLLDEFKKIAEKEHYYADLQGEFEALYNKKKASKSNDLQKFKPEIIEFLTEEIVSRYYLQKGKIETSFATDIELKEAIAILKDADKYKTILTEGYEIKLIDHETEDIDAEEVIIEQE